MVVYWMLVVFIFYCSVLTSIISFISKLNLKFLDFQNKYSIIDDLATHNDVSDDMLKMLSTSIKNRYDTSFNEIELLKPYLNKDL
mmetsp:Transcript_43436/g.94656  ORF Transcript_43436/g.94656 Transcript_43436/m.94656 type:complete len:85 (+) Transcript_43436:1181-1435(+)